MATRNRKGRGTLYRKTQNGKEYGSWIAKFRVDGKVIQVNTKTCDYDEAERLYRQQLERLKIGKMSADRTNVSVADYIAHFMETRQTLVMRGKNKASTLQKYEDALNNFLAFVKDKKPQLRMTQVTTALIEEYMDYRLKQTRFNKGNIPITKPGVNKGVSFLATVFKQAVKEGVILSSPVNENLNLFDVKRTKTREHTAEEIFTDEEVKLILSEIRDHYPDSYPIVAAIAMTGARRAELEHLRRENVDFERNLIHIEPDPGTGWSPKNEASIRAVPMCPELREIMEELLNCPDRPAHSYAFSVPSGDPVWKWPDFPLRRLQSAIRRLRKRKLKIRFGTLRMLRHWFISYGLNRKENPINPAEMIRLVGHTDMSMICRIYYHADLQKVSDKMESFKIVSEAPQE